MEIKISDTARQFLQNKAGFFLSRSRKARIILVAKSCHGAEFRLVYEAPLPEDKLLKAEGCELFVAPQLLAEYGGFTLDTEVFFFARRLLISPLEQKFGCDCKAKCPHKQTGEEAGNTDDKDNAKIEEEQ